MFRSVRPALLAVLLAGCATVTPPEPPTTAQLAVPHRVLVDEARPVVPVDVNLDITRTTFVGFSPVGLLLGAVLTVGDAVVTGITVSNRTARRDELAARLGQTGPVSADFALRFNEALRRQLEREPAVRVDRFEQAPRGAQVALGEGASLRLYRDVVLTTDGRFLVARATALHAVGEGAARRHVARYAVAYSQPVEAPSAEEAIDLWTADGGRLMAERAGPLAVELATLVRLAVFSPQPLDWDNMPVVQLPTSGVSLVGGSSAEGGDVSFWKGPQAYAREQRRDAARVVGVTLLGRQADRWTWISLPAELLPAAGGA